MAENESIGGIQVDIVGDYSTLSQSIDGAAQIAQQGGEKIASALNEGAAGADAISEAVTAAAVGMQSFEAQIQALVDSGSTLAEALQQVQAGAAASGDAAQQAAQQLNLFDEAIQVPYADAAGQLNLFATQLEPIAPAAQQAASSTQNFGDAAQQTGSQAGASGVQIGDLTSKLLEVAGIAISIEAIREFGEACFEAAAEAERMGEGIAFMRGDIAGAADEIERLRSLAQELSQPFEAVGKAAQNFAFLKFSAADTADAMRVADDAAKASGRDFDTLANSLANISLTGMVMPRTLRQLGISMSELSDTMGLTAAQIKVAFKGMDQSDVLSALMASMVAVKGASKAMADDAESNMTRFGNAWTTAKQDVGSFITPFIEQMMPAVTFALKGVATAAIEVVGGIEALVHVLAGIVATALDAIVGLGKAVLLSMTGNIGEAAVVAQTAIAKITQDSKNIWMQYQADAASTTAAVKKLWADQAASVKASSDEEIAARLAAAKAAALAVLAAADAAKELKKEQQELAAFTKSTAAIINESAESYQDYLMTLLDGGKKASSLLSQTTQEILKGEAAVVNMKGAPKEAMEELIAKLKEAQTVWRDFASQDDTAKAMADILDRQAKYAAQVAEEARKIDEQMLADAQKASLMAEQGALIHATALLEIQRTAAAQELSLHQITAFQKLAIDEDIDAKEYALQKQALEQELATLDASDTAEVNYASKREAILLKIQALQDKTSNKKIIDDLNVENAAWKALGIESDKALSVQIQETDEAIAKLKEQGAAQGDLYTAEEKDLQLRITMAERSGADATSQIVGLNNVKLAQQALIDQTRMMGDLYVGIESDILKGWDSLGKAIADNIIDAKNWGDVFKKVGEDVAKMILEQIVGTAFKALKNALLENTDLVGKLGSAFKALAGTVSSSLGAEGVPEGNKLPTGTPGGGPNDGGEVGGNASTGGGASGILGSLGGLASVVQTIFTLVNGIIQDFQLAHLSKVMGQVEENTRYLYLKAAKYFETDSWEQQKGVVTTLGMIDDRLGDIWQTLQDPTKGAGAGVSALNSTLVQNSLNEIVMMTGIYNEISTTNSTLATMSGQLDTANVYLNHLYLAFSNLPKLAGGTPYVPQDMVAIIHQGEAVIPASGFGSLPSIPGASTMLAGAGPQSLGGGSTAGLTQNVSIVVKEASNPRQTARQIASTLKSISGKFGPNGQ